MDSTHTDAAQLIANYLAGRLPASEMDAFEQHVSRDSGIRSEVEQTLRFKEGLGRLRERGELDALLRAPPPRRWSRYAAAASVAFASLAVALWLQLRSPEPRALLLSSGGSATQHGPVAGTYNLARTRGSTGSTDVKLPSVAGLIRLRVVPSADSPPKAGYTVGLRRIDSPTNNPSLVQVKAGPAGSDGYLTVYVDSARLTPGIYELSVAPTVPNGTSAESERFELRVQ